MAGNSYGTLFRITTFGESHGEALGGIIDGCPSGIELDLDAIQLEMSRRKPGQSKIVTQRKEPDDVQFLSGIFEGKTTGTPIGFIIPNTNQKSDDYSHIKDNYRPSHADYVYEKKYGVRDYRGGGRFSGRLTATFVMAGAIARKLLSVTLGIDTYSYTSPVGKIKMKGQATPKMKKAIYSNEVRCPDQKTAQKMRAVILAARKSGDSVGGVIESITSNIPVGLGEPIFGSLESDLSKALYSIPAVKGVEFGSGFYGSTTNGSVNNDEYTIKNGKIVTKTNNAGGILGGLSNGMPIVLRVAFKPASSISKKQNTVDIKTKKPVALQVAGRHDPCVVPRAPPVVDSLVSVVLADHAIRSGFIRPVL